MEKFNLQDFKLFIRSSLKKIASIFTTGFILRYIINEQLCTNIFIESFLLSFISGLLLIIIAETLSNYNFSIIENICEYLFIRPFIFLYSNTLGKNYKGLNIWDKNIKFEDLRFSTKAINKYPENWGELPPVEEIPPQPLADLQADRQHSMRSYHDKMRLQRNSDHANLFKPLTGTFNYKNISKGLSSNLESPDKFIGFTHNINHVNGELPNFLHKSPAMLNLNKETRLGKDCSKDAANSSDDYLYINTSKNHGSSAQRNNKS